MAKNRRKSNRSYQNNDLSFTCCLKKQNIYKVHYLVAANGAEDIVAVMAVAIILFAAGTGEAEAAE